MRLCSLVLSLQAVIAFHVGRTRAECSLEEAELRAAEYGKRFDSEAANFRKTSEGSDSLMSLCIERLNGSETTAVFRNSTQSCLPEEVTYVMQQWNETEQDVNALCVDACPGYAFFPASAHIVDMAALSEQRYTDFCRSMNMSMTYAEGNATNCKFGMRIYYSFLPDGASKFWDDVCRLKCSNLDASIPAIIRCHGDITGRTPTCEEHWDFKQCIYKRGDVCMEVVDKYYIDYNENEKLCITTTSTTSTTTTPTTTATITTTTIASTTTTTSATKIITAITTDTTNMHLSSTETAKKTHTSHVPVFSETSSTSTPPLTLSSESTTQVKMLNFSACITEADHQFFSQQFPNLTKELVMKMLKIKSCLYRLDTDPIIVTKALANLPLSFQEMFIRVQKDGYDVLSTLPDCVKPRPKHMNCDGHNYGILSCSGDTPGCTKILLFVSTLILVERYFQ